MNQSSQPYRSELLNSMSIWYSQWHGYVSLLVCAIGIPMNILNVVVLTRKKMQTSTNCILTWLAVADTSTMMSYVPFAVHFYCEFPSQSISAQKNSRAWMEFLLVYLNFSATTHTISIWLGVALAVFRYHHVLSPAKGGLTRMRRLIRARIVVCLIYIGSALLMIPHYISYNLEAFRLSDNTTVYVFEPWNLGTDAMEPVVLVALLLYCIAAKLIPCFLIIVYGGLLLRTVYMKFRVTRTRLLSYPNMTMSSQRSRDTSRTTSMLLLVIVLFLITEFPQGILILCCIWLKRFFENVYIPLGDTMDILALFNSGVNFILYCSMSREFRQTFSALFTPNLNSNKTSKGNDQTAQTAQSD